MNEFFPILQCQRVNKPRSPRSNISAFLEKNAYFQERLYWNSNSNFQPQLFQKKIEYQHVAYYRCNTVECEQFTKKSQKIFWKF